MKMILEQETFKEYGYYPSDLSPKSSKKILAKCDDCGKVRVIIKKSYHALCQSCSHKGERNPNFGKTGEGRYNWKGGLVKRICETCGKEFEVKRYLIKKGWGRFCSHACATTGENHPSWKGGKVKRICEACGNEFEATPSRINIGEGRFCSQSCANKGKNNPMFGMTGKNNPMFGRNGEESPGWQGGKVKRICEQCGKEFEVTPSTIIIGGGKFCSNECHGKWNSKHKRGENSPTWKGGISFEPYCEKFDFAFKEYIRDKFGRVCFLCPKTEAENGKRLSVHHVNYNKDCMCDGDLTCQFVPLCNSCNTRVNHNRKMWEEKINNMLHNSLNGWYV